MGASDYFVLFLFFSLGVLSVVAGVVNMGWFFQTGSALFFVRHLGRKGARVFYVVVGMAFVGCAIAIFMDWQGR
ncbi:MAG: immunity 17 family protein [Tannerellaceae bacterium]|jgi:small neutral amino acid transporter SnatA (MarC family)|nr:immunity 17 family protein [Tannerellaceae bacterium]